MPKKSIKRRGRREVIVTSQLRSYCAHLKEPPPRGMRDAILRVYPQLEEQLGEHGQKHWRFPPGTLGRMVEPTLDELAAGHRAVSIVRREGAIETAETLERLLSKVQAMLSAKSRRSVGVDLEALLLDNGVAFRPGPRERIAREILSGLRDAMLAGVMISANHRARSSAKLSRNTRLGPIAWLFGESRQFFWPEANIKTVCASSL